MRKERIRMDMAKISHHFSVFYKPEQAAEIELKTRSKKSQRADNELEREFLSNYAGLRMAYEFSRNRQSDLQQREKRQTSECCRVLCLLLMLFLTVTWIG